MTILHLSDAHSQHRRLTQLHDADILGHSEDFTMNGSEQEAIDFIVCYRDWLWSGCRWAGVNRLF